MATTVARQQAAINRKPGKYAEVRAWNKKAENENWDTHPRGGHTHRPTDEQMDLLCWHNLQGRKGEQVPPSHAQDRRWYTKAEAFAEAEKQLIDLIGQDILNAEDETEYVYQIFKMPCYNYAVETSRTKAPKFKNRFMFRVMRNTKAEYLAHSAIERADIIHAWIKTCEDDGIYAELPKATAHKLASTAACNHCLALVDEAEWKKGKDAELWRRNVCTGLELWEMERTGSKLSLTINS